MACSALNPGSEVIVGPRIVFPLYSVNGYRYGGQFNVMTRTRQV